MLNKHQPDLWKICSIAICHAHVTQPNLYYNSSCYITRGALLIFQHFSIFDLIKVCSVQEKSFDMFFNKAS